MTGETEKCKHPHFRSEVKFKWVTNKEIGVRQLVGILRVWCDACKAPYVFKAPDGFSTEEPTLSPTGEELRIPMGMPEEPEDDRFFGDLLERKKLPRLLH